MLCMAVQLILPVRVLATPASSPQTSALLSLSLWETLSRSSSWPPHKWCLREQGEVEDLSETRLPWRFPTKLFLWRKIAVYGDPFARNKPTPALVSS